MVKFGVFWVSSGRSDQLAQAPIGKSGPDGQKRGKIGYFGGFGGGLGGQLSEIQARGGKI